MVGLYVSFDERTAKVVEIMRYLNTMLVRVHA
jgi:hypothetical protein